MCGRLCMRIQDLVVFSCKSTHVDVEYITDDTISSCLITQFKARMIVKNK